MKLTALFPVAAVLVAVSLPTTAQPQRPVQNPRQAAAPRVGEPAPDFKLTTKDGQRGVRLSNFKGQRPVVLVFGSFT